MYMHDALIIVFLQFLSLLAIAFSWRLEPWFVIVIINMLCSAAIVVIAGADHRTHNVFLDGIHRYYVVVLIFGIFKEIYVVLPSVNPLLYDNVLIAIDHALFGVHPTQWLAQFANPALVEFFQICYSSFYLIMLAMIIEMSVRRHPDDYEKYTTTIVYGFFLSYIGYLIWPAVGPRFTLHDFPSLSRELPGLWTTETLRTWINSGESIQEHSAHFFATAQRDAFPSGHTQMTLLTIVMAWNLRASVRVWVTFVGIGLIIGTVFLRYHYVTDVLGGVAFFFLTQWTIPFLERWWQRVQQFAASPLSPP